MGLQPASCVAQDALIPSGPGNAHRTGVPRPVLLPGQVDFRPQKTFFQQPPGRASS